MLSFNYGNAQNRLLQNARIRPKELCVYLHIIYKYAILVIQHISFKIHLFRPK